MRFKPPKWKVSTSFLAGVLLLFGTGTTLAAIAGWNSRSLHHYKVRYSLVIPSVMKNNGEANKYEISEREFRQQILPGGIWNTINGRNDKFNPNQGLELWS